MKTVIIIATLVIGFVCGYLTAINTLSIADIRQYFYDQHEVLNKNSCTRLDIDRFTAICTSGSSWVEPIDETEYKKVK